MRSEGYGTCVCVCVCLSVCLSSSSIFSSVRSSHKGYHVLNGQWRSNISNGFLWKRSVAKLEREKANMQIHNGLLRHDHPRALRTSEAPEDATKGVYRLSHAI